MASALFALAFLYYSFFFLDASTLNMPNAYQARDIRRALALYYDGVWTLYGPELSGGGHLPGPFYYILIGLPLWLFRSIMSLYYFEYALAASAAAVFWLFLKRNFSFYSANVFYFLFVTSPFFNSMLLAFMNPSFQFLLLAVAIWCLHNEKNRHSLALGAFFLGLALQVHFACSVLLIAVFISILLSDYSLLDKFKKIGIAALFVLLPALPYLYFRIFLLNDNSSYYFLTAGVGKLVYALRVAFITHPNEFMFSPESALRVLPTLLRDLYFLPGLILAWVYRKYWVSRSFLATAFFVSTLLICFVSTSASAPRYLVPLFILTLIVFSLLVSKLFLNRKLLVALFCMLTLFWPKLVVDKFENSAGNPAPMSVSLGNALIDEIRETTGWSYDYFRLHTYVSGIHSLDDFSTFYRDKESRAVPSASQRYDGLIIDTPHVGMEGLPFNFQVAFRQGRIKCSKLSKVEHFELCYYNFSDPAYASAWHNIGYAYDFKIFSEFKTIMGSGLHILGPREVVFFNNPCAVEEETCSAFFSVKLLEKALLSVQILGDPYSVIDPYNNPTMSGALVKPALEVVCGERVSEIVLTSYIGIDRVGFITPFNDFYELPCEKPESITLKALKGYATYQTTSFRLTRGNKFKPFSIKWVLD